MSVNRHFDGASSTSISTTTTTTTEKATTQKKAVSSVLKLKLKTDKKPSKHIHWSEDTVDNEELNRKKSNSIKEKKKQIVFNIEFISSFCLCSLLYIPSQ